MEEKERYELFGEFGIIHDTSPNAECMLLNKFQTCEILNKQDKENQQLKKQLAEKDAERELDNSFWKQECDSLQKTLVEKENIITTLIEDSKTSKELLKNQLAEKETRIAELEEQLKNATHKFSIGKEVYYLDYKYKFEPYVSKYLAVCKGKILDIILREGGYVEYNFTFDDLKWIAEENCFLTKEEAEAKLRELKEK